MKTTHGIPCNETRFTPKADRDRITYQFVSGDGITPASCTVKLGDTDPLTGEKLTDLEFFHAYYRQVDKEIHNNLGCLRPDYTEEQKAWRKEEARRYIADFRKKYGYAPSRDDILWHLEQEEKNRYCQYYDSLVNEDGDSLTDCIPDFGRRDEDPFGADLPDEIYALRELVETLQGRKKDVYEAMLQNLAGGGIRITNVELARRWGVYENCIRQDQAQIRKMIREKLKK